MKNTKNIIFDLDGTLWDSRQQIANAWNEILSSKFNITMDINAITSLMGKTSDEIKTIIFNKISTDNADNLIKQCELQEVKYLAKNGANIYKNTIKTLKNLSKMHNIYIVSNCQSGYIESFLTYYKLNDYIIDYECNGNTKLPKAQNIKLIMNRNNLSKESCVYVGDTYSDYESAQNNEILFIYANYGFEKLTNQLFQINDISELTKYFDK